MSKNVTINGVAYNGVSNVTIGSAIFRDADEVITTPTATKTITENGSSIDILNYAKATVNVPVGVSPTGTLVLNLSESVADQDCANYAKVTVNITKDSSTPVLSGISATYSGGTVAAGTTVDSLTGISITATYTLSGYNGTLTKSGITTGYTLSGTLTAGQTNTVTVTYGGKTATIQVPVAAEALVLDKLVVTYDNSTAVTAGTALSALNEVVKAQYTNGTQTAALTEGTDYELSGTLTAGQANTITVTGKGTYAGLASVTFSVTVEAETASTVTSTTMRIYPKDYNSDTYGAMVEPYIQTARVTANGFTVLGTLTNIPSDYTAHGCSGDITFAEPLAQEPNKLSIMCISEDDPTAVYGTDIYNATYTKQSDGSWIGAGRGSTAGATYRPLVQVGGVAWRTNDAGQYIGIDYFLTKYDSSASINYLYVGKSCPHGLLLTVSTE